VPADIARVTRTRSLVATGMAIALVLVLTACGGQQFSDTHPAPTGPAAPNGTPPTTGKAATPTGRLLAAAARTTDAKTARMALDMKIAGLGSSGSVEVTGVGVMDLAHRRFELTMQGRGAAAALDLEMRVIGDTAYLRTGSSWISETVAATGASTPVPTDYLQYLQGVSGAVRSKGHETLRGVDTTRYVVTLDLGRALTRIADSSQRAAIQHALTQFGLNSFPATVWIDGQGRLRRMDLTLDLSKVARTFGASTGAALKLQESVEMYDFGVAVDVQAPPNASKVTLGNGVSLCVPPACSTNADTTPDIGPVHDIQSDLRDALTAEKVYYVDNGVYTADAATLRRIESTLQWGGKLTARVGSSRGGRNDIVCLSEGLTGSEYSIVDVASGPRAGTYYGQTACGAVSEAILGSLARHW
jgi:hypothetical protein